MQKLKTVSVALICAAVMGPIAWAEESNSTQSVEQRLSVLEKKYEEGATVTAGKDGFFIKSNDGSFFLKIGGYIQGDYRAFLDDINQTGVDQFVMRRARVGLEGTMNKFVDFRLITDLGGGVSRLQDANIDLKASRAFKFRMGKFTSPVALEQLQSDKWLFFAERGLPSNLSTARDVGAQVFGDFWKGAFTYAAGVFNGGVDGSNGDGDNNDEKQYEGRLWFQPFKNSSVEALKDFGFGLGGSSGKQPGSVATTNLPTYKTNGQQIFFNYNSNVFADGTHSRISPQGYWYAGPFGLLGEYIASSQDVKKVAASTTTAKLTNTSWQVELSYVLTGEKATYKGVTPRRGLDNHGAGAWEIAARFGELCADADSFSLYADPTKSADRARSWTGGLNWYATSNLKWVANYEHTQFHRGGPNQTDRPTEKAIITRLQVVF